MSDIGPYGITQNADAEMVTANELVGERAGNVFENQSDPRFSRAMFSTAPYKKPREGKCIGKEHTCEARPIKGTDLCWFHSQKDIRESSAAS